MPTRKISDDQDTRPCRHPDHDPPNMRVFEPGLYEHECPACHRKTVFRVQGVFMKASKYLVPTF